MQPISSVATSDTSTAAAGITAAAHPATKPETFERQGVPLADKPSAQNAETRPSFQQLEQAAKRIEKFVHPISSDLQFSVDETSGISVVRVIDRATQQVIRQMPSEETLAIASALDRLQGLLMRQKA